MKKIICTVMVFAFWANVSAQIEVDATGNTHVSGNIYLESDSNIIAATGNTPITFKVNGVLAGNTGNPEIPTVSFGCGALRSNTTGFCNTANGVYALSSNTTGSYNTANGTSALSHNTTGSLNTANGMGVLSANTTGSENTANGFWALYSNTTGSYNTANGVYALYYNTTGSYNTAIGYGTAVNASNHNNVTAIGYGTTATSSNQVKIGNSSVTSIGGYVNWTNFSDKRAKKNIRTDVPGLAFINGLQPITYNLDLDAIDALLKIDRTKREGEEELSQELKDINRKAREAKEKVIQTGFIAQDVEKVAKSIGYDFSGVDVDETGIYGLRYAEFVVPLVKAVQELSAQVKELQEENAALSTLRSESAVTGLQQLTANGASLQQNIPNPFSQTTQIKYYLPESVKTASLNIYNLQGKQIKQIAVTQRGEGSQLISGSEFPAGIYLYALIADGQKVDIKQMILTE